jgi:hypothetical protein
MAGTLGYALEVTHVFQRRFDSENLATALAGSHLYLISRRPAIRLNRESITAREGQIAFDILTRKSVRASLESHPLTLRPDAGLEVADFRTYSNGAYFSFRCNGMLVHGDAWALASLASNASPDLAAQEVLYVGQAYGTDGSSNSWKRTRRHSTLQRIYEDHAGEDWDIFISPIAIVKVNRSTEDHIGDDEEATIHVLGMDKEDPFFNARQKEILPTSINLVEHALIHYFDAPYNELLKEWRPGRPTGAMSRMKAMGFRLLLIHLDGWQGLARYFSSNAERARSHFFLLAIDDDPKRGDPRINYNPNIHNWRFQFGLDMHKGRLTAAETSTVVMKIFGDEAPRIRRPREASLPDRPAWSLEESKERYRKLIGEQINYRGPSYSATTGLFSFGQYADGKEAHWQLVRPGEGVRHGVIAGTRGAGKTNALNVLRIEALCSTLFYLISIDPSGRHDAALWREYADAVAETIEDSIDMLNFVESEVAARHRANYKFPADGLGLLVTVEDAHLLFDRSPKAAGSADAIARFGESVGVSLVVTVPDLNVGRFGGLETMRAAFKKSMVAAFGGPDAYEMFTEGDE